MPLLIIILDFANLSAKSSSFLLPSQDRTKHVKRSRIISFIYFELFKLPGKEGGRLPSPHSYESE